MTFYQHYSFDLWLTLIKSNPLFKTKRTLFFYENFNTKGKSLDEVGVVFRQVDLLCNSINEKTGGNIDAEEMYLMVISIINDYSICFDDVDINRLYEEMELLLFNFLPLVYCDQTLNVLERLKNRENTTISLLSNTGFIKGRTLRKVLQELEVDQYLDFQLYSDEEGLSKPNEKLFQLMINEIKDFRKEEIINKKQIIHIGDNEHADFYGAQTIGVNSYLINSNNKSITSLIY
ncbi:dehalogenase [Solitalea longa]|uniref:Dehalogenase n=1 Tax=Solitalea longa TaxID=2079460 RepID=A0A2S5A3T7_9SPHI|nr:HAD family hydrolase [Solitalea longa]POY36982.1 dehalogenase [Solitalea longa]